jgi:hypothetical protein
VNEKQVRACRNVYVFEQLGLKVKMGIWEEALSVAAFESPFFLADRESLGFHLV